MLKKVSFLIVLVVAGLILAACSGTTTVVPSYASGTAAGLSVNGRGQVVLPPDVAYVTIGVHTEATDVSNAVQNNANQVAAVMASLSEAGVAPEDMQTSNFSVYTTDNYDPMTGLINGKKYSPATQKIFLFSTDWQRLQMPWIGLRRQRTLMKLLRN